MDHKREDQIPPLARAMGVGRQQQPYGRGILQSRSHDCLVSSTYEVPLSTSGRGLCYPTSIAYMPTLPVFEAFYRITLLTLILPHCKMFSYKSNCCLECRRRHHLTPFSKNAWGGGMPPNEDNARRYTAFSPKRLACLPYVRYR